ncbi:unnamed protein product [Rhizophagus irregularis]|nr:unnamed protein product [Rhizophagus irregularis]
MGRVCMEYFDKDFLRVCIGRIRMRFLDRKFFKRFSKSSYRKGLRKSKVLQFLDFEDDGYRRPSLWIGIGETLSRIGCNLWILGIDWHRLGPLDRYRLRPLETCGVKLGPLETKPVVYGFLVLSELNFKGQQLFG